MHFSCILCFHLINLLSIGPQLFGSAAFYSFFPTITIESNQGAKPVMLVSRVSSSMTGIPSARTPAATHNRPQPSNHRQPTHLSPTRLSPLTHQQAEAAAWMLVSRLRANSTGEHAVIRILLTSSKMPMSSVNTLVKLRLRMP